MNITTNDSLLGSFVPRIRGLADRIRVSLHSADPDAYGKITGRAVLPEVLKGILKAREAGIDITLNRLLLKDYLEDVPEYFDFAVRKGLRVKLLQRHFTSSDFSSFEAEDELMKSVVASYLQPLVEGNPFLIDADPLSPRRVFPLKNGARVELRLPNHKIISRFSYCGTCSLKPRCEKSSCLLTTSVKFTPDNRLVFCSVTNRPSIDLNKGLLDGSVDEVANDLESEMKAKGLYPEGFYLPIRVS